MTSVTESERQVGKIAFVASIYPLLFLLCLYATNVAAWLELGRPPPPSLDDPKDLGLAVLIFHLPTWLLIMASPLGMIFSAGAILRESVNQIANSYGNSGRVVIMLAVASFCWWLAFVHVYNGRSEVFL